MDDKHRRLASIVLAPLFLSACGAPATATPTPSPTPAETIQLVALGDSTPAAYGVVHPYVDYYAEYIEEDLGVRVEVHNWARNGLRMSEVLTALQEDEALRDDVRNADVITLWAGFNDIYPAIGIHPEGAICGPWASLDLDCVARRVTGLNESIDGIVAALLTLTDPDETLILFADVGNPLAEEWAAVGLLDALRGPVMEAWTDHITEACEGTGIRVVHTYEAINGPEGNLVPDPEIGQDDGLHLSQKGHRLLADVHRQVGYGPLSR